MSYDIQPIESAELRRSVQHKIDQKTKPPGALGRLESLALKIALIQQTECPVIRSPLVAVFAGDHGVTAEGVSAFPSEVTAQMVLNFLSGGAAINVFARQNGLALKIVDAGVDFEFAAYPDLLDRKIAAGTNNFVAEPAMSPVQCERALAEAAELVDGWYELSTNVIGFGEMGIGNTSSAAVLTALYADQPLADCVGAGTGLDAGGVQAKLRVLERALVRTGLDTQAVQTDPWVGLREYGGFEIAMICGAMLRAAEHRMLVLVDGFIATSAYLVARAVNPIVGDYCVLTHRSAEVGHTPALRALDEMPLLDLGMRLGEGTGAAVALPIVAAAVNFLNEMASFEDAAVSGKKA